MKNWILIALSFTYLSFIGIVVGYDIYDHEKDVPAINDYELNELSDKIINSTVIIETRVKDPKELEKAQRFGIVGHGTGFFYDVNEDSAIVITNHHVIESAIELPQVVKIIVSTTTRPWDYEAEIVGYDKITDLAVLRIKKIDKEIEWEPIPWYDTNKSIKEGTSILTVGHGLGQFWGVSTGVISATLRWTIQPYNFMVQHDAVINLGSSGGPVVNMQGELVAINDMIISPGGNPNSRVKPWSGVSIAISHWQAKRSIEQILDKGYVTYPTYDFNIVLPDVSEMEIQDELNDGDLEKRTYAKIGNLGDDPQGMKVGDLITHVDDVPVWSVIHLVQEVLKKDVGQVIKISIIRGKVKYDVDYKLQPLSIEEK